MDDKKMLHLAKSSTVSVRFPPEILNGNLSVLYVVTILTSPLQSASVSISMMMDVQGAIWQHLSTLQLHCQPLYNCKNCLVQVHFGDGQQKCHYRHNLDNQQWSSPLFINFGMTRNGKRLDHEGLNVEKASQDGAKILIKKGKETKT